MGDYSKNWKKAQFWHKWYQEYGYQTAVSQCCIRRGCKVAAMILRTLHTLSKESQERKCFANPEEFLLQKKKNFNILPSLQKDLCVELYCENRRRYVHSIMHSMKTSIRKWKHFVEIRRTQGSKVLILGFWTKFWLKTAMEGWRITLQKKKLKRKSLHYPNQQWNKERKIWAPKKQKDLQESPIEGAESDVALKWRNYVLEKLSFISWTHVSVLQNEQIKRELWKMLQLKRWWILAMLSHWRELAHKYAKGKGKLCQSEWFLLEQEPENVIHRKGPNTCKSNGKCLQVAWHALLVHAKIDHESKTTVMQFQKAHLREFLTFLRKYTRQQKLVKVLQAVQKSTYLQLIWKKWQYSAVMEQHEKPVILLIKEYLTKFPHNYKVMNTVMSFCPRWASYKGLQVWREWGKLQFKKRRGNRRALEHLAKLLCRKAFASFQKVQIGVQIIKMSRKHSDVRSQVKVLLAWKNFTREHIEHKFLKHSSYLYHRNKTWNMVLKMWKMYLHFSQKDSIAKNKAASFWRVSSLQKCLKSWVEVLTTLDNTGKWLAYTGTSTFGFPTYTAGSA